MENEKPIAVFYAYEQEDVELYSHASGCYCALDGIINMLRSKDKYGTNYKTVEEAIEKIREEALDIISQYHLPGV